ncbi:hypothetical protein [Pseudomonas sp. v388]|uniref:hypothetical protein n=1 Tax=Pseudomonas sp. v388 TaxID=2479849 RepID=UPI002113E155|nr:hypothetical protein [Pseudomonas sp. v388]
MKMIHRILALLTLALVLGGCTSKPVYNARESLPKGAGFTEARMSSAIVNSLNERTWVIQSTRPGMIKAAITVRGRHHAEIDIPYTATTFEINYRSSTGLNYKDGEIHRNYNRWVDRLRSDILQKLGVAAQL